MPKGPRLTLKLLRRTHDSDSAAESLVVKNILRYLSSATVWNILVGRCPTDLKFRQLTSQGLLLHGAEYCTLQGLVKPVYALALLTEYLCQR